MHANAVYLRNFAVQSTIENQDFTIVNARGAAERRFLYNPLRQLRDEEPRSPSLRRAPEDAMPQHATAWAKREFPKLPHLARRAFSQAYLAYFPGTPSPEASASGCKQIAHPALLLSSKGRLLGLSKQHWDARSCIRCQTICCGRLLHVASLFRGLRHITVRTFSHNNQKNKAKGPTMPFALLP